MLTVPWKINATTN